MVLLLCCFVVTAQITKDYTIEQHSYGSVTSAWIVALCMARLVSALKDHRRRKGKNKQRKSSAESLANVQ